MSTNVERSFDYAWRVCKPDDLEDPIEQCRCDAQFDMRFDRAWIEKLVAVEISGGAWSSHGQNGHNRGSGMMRDYKRHNFATALGWRVFYAIENMYQDDPQAFFAPIIAVLRQPVLSPDAELRMWTARVCNLTRDGMRVSANGVTVQRKRLRQYVVTTASGIYPQECAPAELVAFIVGSGQVLARVS